MDTKCSFFPARSEGNTDAGCESREFDISETESTASCAGPADGSCTCKSEKFFVVFMLRLVMLL